LDSFAVLLVVVELDMISYIIIKVTSL
jgi:hypothetical protein